LQWSLGPVELLTPATLALMKLNYRFSSAKAAARLGYAPAFSCDEGLQKTIALTAVAMTKATGGVSRSTWA
jgi:hypothetical protein